MVELKSVKLKIWKEAGGAHLEESWTITCLGTCSGTCLWSLVCDRRSLVFADIHGLPFTLNNSRADLCGSFSFASLFIGIQIFTNTDSATGAVFADEAIEKAFVALAAIAMAIARLLVENFFYMGC